MKRADKEKLTELYESLKGNLPKLFLNHQGQFCKQQGNEIVVVSNAEVLQTLEPLHNDVDDLGIFAVTAKTQ